VPNRDQLAERLKKLGIPTAVYYPKCLHEQPVFSKLGYKLGDFPESEKAAREVLSLPMHPFLTPEDQDKIITAVKNCLGAVQK
jgi:UDP-2-acetamido-2-deoxy-ribo-hexuluronate aminotransferase